GERLEAATLNGRVMNEAVLLPAFRRDKAEALLIVEPLDRASRTHMSYSSCSLLCSEFEDTVRTNTTCFVIMPSRWVSRDRGTKAVGRKKDLLAIRQAPSEFGTCPCKLHMFRLFKYSAAKPSRQGPPTSDDFGRGRLVAPRARKPSTPREGRRPRLHGPVVFPYGTIACVMFVGA